MPKKTNIEINGHRYYRATATVGTAPDGKPIRKQFYGDSKKEAEAKRDEYLYGIRMGLPVGYDKTTFGHVFREWFECVLKPSVSLTSYARYEIDYRHRIKDSQLSNQRLTDIKPHDIQVFYNKLLESHTANTVRNTNKLLSHFFSYCLKTDLIIKNPTVAVELPKDNQIKDELDTLSRDEIQQVINAAKENPANFIFVFAIFTGMREGEILALTHADVDTNAGIIKVNKTVSYLTISGKYSVVLRPTKTRGSTREIPILDDIKPLLHMHIKSEKEKFLHLGIPFSDTSILFSSTACTYIEASNIRKRLTRLFNRLGMKQRSFHKLRHTFCTLLAETGVPLTTAAKLMGHTDIGITAKIYTHVDTDEKRRGIGKLAGIFNAQ